MTIFGLAVVICRVVGGLMGLWVACTAVAWAAYGLQRAIDPVSPEQPTSTIAVAVVRLAMYGGIAWGLTLRSAAFAQRLVPPGEDRPLAGAPASSLVALLLRMVAAGVLAWVASVLSMWAVFGVMARADFPWSQFLGVVAFEAARVAVAWGLWTFARPLAARAVAGVEPA